MRIRYQQTARILSTFGSVVRDSGDQNGESLVIHSERQTFGGPLSLYHHSAKCFAFQEKLFLNYSVLFSFYYYSDNVSIVQYNQTSSYNNLTGCHSGKIVISIKISVNYSIYSIIFSFHCASIVLSINMLLSD